MLVGRRQAGPLLFLRPLLCCHPTAAALGPAQACAAAFSALLNVIKKQQLRKQVRVGGRTGRSWRCRRAEERRAVGRA